MTELVLFGAGDYAQVVCAYLEEDPDYHVAAFTVDREHLQQDTLLGHPVVPFDELPRHFPARAYSMLVTVGYSRLNQVRREKFEAVQALGYQLASYVCRSSHVPRSVSIGRNCIVLDGNHFQPFSTLGDNTIVWSCNVIGHHARIGRHCCITSGTLIGSRSEMGDHCFAGFGCGISEHVRIGDGCVIGAGAMVMRDAEPHGVYTGARAKRSRVPSSRFKGL